VKELTVFFGGNIGSDPQSPKTWSGSGLFMLNAMRQADLLCEAFGLKLPRLQNSFFLAKNFHRNRSIWRTHYYFDPGYRAALSRSASAFSIKSPVLFQTGHMFCLRNAFPNRKCISYHDGNLAVRLGSGFGFEGVSRQRIDQALRYEEDVAGQMSAVFTMSEYARSSFINDYHVSPERVFCVGGGINLIEFPAEDPNKVYSAPRILFIGTEFVRKGGPQLLQAFRIVREARPDAELHIVGPAEQKDSQPGVFFHGHLSKSNPEEKLKLESLFRSCSLFVLPSLYEPFGIAPLEAMLYQLPCVVTDAWALRETVTAGFNGDLVPKGSVEGLAASLLKMISDPEALAKMGRQGRERALQQFSWAAVIDRMSVALKSISE